MKQSIRINSVAAAVAAAFGAVAAPAFAQLPSGPTVVNGSAGVASDGTRMTITNSANAVLNWQSFSIGAPNSVRFEQPSASSQVLNRVVGNDPSNILGSLSSNGGVWLVNPHGVLFGNSARIDVAGLVASSLGISNDDFLAGRVKFDGGGLPSGQVLNRGELQTSFGGHVWLVGGSVSNEGLVRSPGGSIVLAAGKSIELVDSGAPNVAVRVAAPDSQALNLGQLLAPGGGSIDIHGGIVNQQGIVRADSVGLDAAGRVTIKARGEIQLGAGSETSASAAGAGAGGKVLVESDDGSALVQGRVNVTSSDGDGGKVHLLGKEVRINGQAVVDASGTTGGGEILAGGDYHGANPLVKNAAQTYLGVGASLKANATGKGNGGKVILWGDDATRVYGSIQARGGPHGGDGGFAETSGHVLDARPVQVDLGSSGGKAGSWLLDPYDVHIVGNSSLEGGMGNDSVSGGEAYISTRDSSAISASRIVDSLSQGTSVTISTGNSTTAQLGDIVVDSSVIVPASSSPIGSLTLNAHHDIILQKDKTIASGSAPLNLTLLAGRDQKGGASISLLSGASIVTMGGTLTMTVQEPATAPRGRISMAAGSSLDARYGTITLKARDMDMAQASGIGAGNITANIGALTMTKAGMSVSSPVRSSIDLTVDNLTMTGSALNATSIGDSAITVNANGATLDGSAVKASTDEPITPSARVQINGNSVMLKNASELQGTAVGIGAYGITVDDSKITALNVPGSTVDLEGVGIALHRSTIDAPHSDADPERRALYLEADSIVLIDSLLRTGGRTRVDSNSLTIAAETGAAGIQTAGLVIDSDGVDLKHAALSSSTSGLAMDIRASVLSNDSSTLSAPSGYWTVLLHKGLTGFPAAALGNLDYKYVQVGVDASTPVPADRAGQNGIRMEDPLKLLIRVNATRDYDGSTDAPFSAVESSDVLPGFKIQPLASGASFDGRFNDKAAGDGKPVYYDGSHAFDVTTTAGIPVYGEQQNYYADIKPKPLTATGLSAENKVYDGTPKATVYGELSGAVGNDDVTLVNLTGLFDDKNVGTGKTVTVSGGALAGLDRQNYTVQVGGTTTANIAKLEITAAGVVASDKVYDGSAAATLSGGFTQMLPGDQLSVSSVGAMFDNENAGQNKVVSFTSSILAGADAGNYLLRGPLTTTASITPKPVTIALAGPVQKIYDGTTSATLGSSQFTIQGMIAGDAINVNGPAQGSFDTRNVGQSKLVSASGNFTITGADAPNYSIGAAALSSSGTSVAASVSANVGTITPKSVSVSNMVAQNKVYDGNRTAALSGAPSGIVAGDSVSVTGLTGLFDTRNAGTGKTVTISGGTLAGADAGNYSFDGVATTTADITQRPLTATGIVASDKIYDGSTAATLSGGFSGALPGDALSLGTTAGEFDTKNAGAGKTVTFTGSILAGADAANYMLTGPLTTTASIMPKPVTISITGTVSKEYDATANASLGAGQFALNGLVANDALTVRGPAQGSYDSPNAGAGRQVSASGAFEISGADAPNYSVDGVKLTSADNVINASASGNGGIIKKATLVYTAAPASGEPGLPATGLGGTVTGFKGSDTLANATTGTLAWQSDATLQSMPGAYGVNGTGLSSANYDFVQAPANASALAVKFDLSPAKPQLQAQESSVQAIGTALRTAMLAVEQHGSGGGVFDTSGPAAARSFGNIRIGAMSQSELAQLLAQRREFKRKLFAEAVYKLEIDPSLADVQLCASAADAATGACRLTPAQVELIHATKRPAHLAAKSASGRVAALPQIERKIVVLFGINDYQDKAIPQLENALPDVDAVSRTFAEKLGYEVRVVRNPNKAEMIRTLNGLAAEMNSADSVIIYYAGHGFAPKTNGPGYWIPSDAKSSDPRTWISNSDVAKAMANISAKQMALISDSCYSGAFARDGVDAVGHDVSVADVLAKRSVVVLSSGGDEPVADEGKEGHSIFAWNLMQVIGSVTDWKPGSTIFTNVQAAVKKEFPQTPQYGSVTAAGHQAGGEYLFELR